MFRCISPLLSAVRTVNCSVNLTIPKFSHKTCLYVQNVRACSQGSKPSQTIVRIFNHVETFSKSFMANSKLLWRQLSYAMILRRKRHLTTLFPREEFHLQRVARDVPKLIMFGALFPIPFSMVAYLVIIKLFPPLMPSAFHPMTLVSVIIACIDRVGTVPISLRCYICIAGYNFDVDA